MKSAMPKVVPQFPNRRSQERRNAKGLEAEKDYPQGRRNGEMVNGDG